MARLINDDFNSAAIQAMELMDDAVAVTIGLTTSSYALPSSAELVRVALSEDSFIRFGLSGVTVSSSNGHYFPKGVEVLVVPHPPFAATHVAVIAAAGTTGFGSITSGA
jgi:hypothetical protein